MLVSIIIPIYNSEDFLSECLASLGCQSYEDIEVICIDDGSKDGSAHICKGWSEKDSRFRYYFQENSGVCVARNKGLKVAKGEYLCFVDSDDILHQDFIKELVARTEPNKTVVCQISKKIDCLGKGDTLTVYPLRQFINLVVFEKIKHPGFTCFLYNNNIIKENNLCFVEGCVRNEDYEFYMKYLSCSKGVVVNMDYVGYYYRTNPFSEMESPLTLQSLTSIEASRRINKYLFDKGHINDNIIVLSNGVLTYAYSIAKRGNWDLYDYLHSNYDVRNAMVKMLFFPRLSKKIVAVAYLLLGKDLFFYTIGTLRFIK